MDLQKRLAGRFAVVPRVVSPSARRIEVKFTADDLRDWQAYEEVRKSGRHNMYSSAAQEETGLTDDRYVFVMRNFSELKAAANPVKGETP